MKTKNNLNSRLLIAIIPFALLISPSCNEDSETPPSEIQFSVSQQNVSEGDEATISLLLDRPAPRNTSVMVKIETNAFYNEHYSTVPSPNNGSIQVEVARGATNASFTVQAIDNSDFDHGKYVILSLHSPADGLRLVAGSILVLTIDDDEGPSLANFGVNSGTLDETNQDGIIIQIPLSAPAKGYGSVNISISSVNADGLFEIDKEMVNGMFSMPVIENQTHLSFIVKPKSNDLYTGNTTVILTISGVGGVVQKGNNLTYTLMLKDDELPSIVNFETNGGIVNEGDASGVKIDIPFSGTAKGTGRIVITFTSSTAKYGINFTTNPAPEVGKNYIEFPIGVDDPGIDLTVLPKNDFTVTGNMEITFSISSVEGVVLKGNKLNYSLTIINEDNPVKVNFQEVSGSLEENNAGGITINLPFSGPAPGGGTITVTYSSSNLSNGMHFTTVPPTSSNNSITLNVDKNDMSKSFTVKPVNNSSCWNLNHSNLIEWKITLVTGGAIEKGENLTYNLALNDDEAINFLHFSESEGTISESKNDGIEVKLVFSKPVEANGYVSINTEWYEHQGKLVTTPAYDYNCYWSYCNDPYISFMQGDTGVSFKISPIDNAVNEPDYLAQFRVYSHSNNGCIQLEGNAKYSLTIIDDD